MSIVSKLLGLIGGSPAEIPVTSPGIYRAPRKETSPTPVSIPTPGPAQVPLSPVEPSIYVESQFNPMDGIVFVSGSAPTGLIGHSGFLDLSGMGGGYNHKAWTIFETGQAAVYDGLSGCYVAVTNPKNNSIIRQDLLDSLTHLQREQLLRFVASVQPRNPYDFR